MRYAKFFLDDQYDDLTFSCVFAHHIRQHPRRKNFCAMQIDEYCKIVEAPAVYIMALRLAEDSPTAAILEEMNLTLGQDGKLRNKDD